VSAPCPSSGTSIWKSTWFPLKSAIEFSKMEAKIMLLDVGSYRMVSSNVPSCIPDPVKSCRLLHSFSENSRFDEKNWS